MHTQNAAEKPLKGQQVIVATNATEELPSSLFYNLYGARVVEEYAKAAEALGAHVEICTLEQTLSRLTNFDEPVGFVINVCAAFHSLEGEGLVQAVAALSGTPCFPCRGDVAIIAEEKIISKHIAAECGFRTLPSLRNLNQLGRHKSVVRKPISGGDSKGVVLERMPLAAAELGHHEFAEPFVAGTDLEVFCVVNPTTGQHHILNAKVRLPIDGLEYDLVHATSAKFSSDDYDPDAKVAISWKSVCVADCVGKAVQELGQAFHKTFLFRIDGRTQYRPDNPEPLELNDFVFLELNVMPTIPGDAGWLSPALFKWAKTDPAAADPTNQLSDGQLALRLLLAIWRQGYVQSKSVDGNTP